MLGVFSEYGRAMILSRVRAGLARAKERGTKSGRAIGRPKTPKAVRDLKAIGLAGDQVRGDRRRPVPG
jgi:DNA invertase Pin-like site-specific DNA recombinase